MVNNCSQQFGGSAAAIKRSLGCSDEEANRIATAYNTGFPGIADFKKKGSEQVRSKGYILLNPITGHKTYWWDFPKWKATKESFTSEFWEEYKPIKEKKLQAKSENKPVDYYLSPSEKEISAMVSENAKAAAKWDRKALNSVTQGTGAVCLKHAGIKYFNWIIDNGYFNKVLITDFVHDEICTEYPENLAITSEVLKNIMEEVTAIYCKSLPIPAEPAIAKHWVH